MNFECDRCPQEFARWENLERHIKQERHSTPYECQFCHDEDLWFKSRTASRKHFIFSPRKIGEQRSQTVISCVTFEKRKKDEKEKKRKEAMEKERKRNQDLMQKWMDMSEVDKEKERELHRAEEIDFWGQKIDMWQLAEEKKEGMRKRLYANIQSEDLSDEKMAMVMAKKWS